MKVKVPLAEAQIAEALREYVVRKGFVRASVVEFRCSPGWLPGEPTVFSATVDADTKDPA